MKFYYVQLIEAGVVKYSSVQSRQLVLNTTERNVSPTTTDDTNGTIERHTKTFKSIFFLDSPLCIFFRDGDTSQARSQWHFIALDADFHCMCRSAFFPDICELSHLFIQSTDTFLGGCLKPG